MAIKTKITPFNASHTGVHRTVWVVASDIDADIFKEISHGGVVVSLDNGESLTNWTAGKGLGDWDDIALSGYNVYVTFPQVLRTNKKVKNFLEELGDYMDAAGAKLYVLELPKGRFVSEAFHNVNVSNVMDLVKEFNPAFSNDDDGMDTTAKVFDPTHGDFLYDIAERDYFFCRSENKEYFLLPKAANEPNLAFMVGEPELRQALTRKFRQQAGNIPGATGLDMVMGALASECAVSQSKLDAVFRIGDSKDGNYWMDLGTDDGLAIRYNAEGWEIVQRMPSNVGFAFRRSNSIKPLPKPVKMDVATAADVLDKHLHRFINVSDAQWPMVVAYMINHMIPGYKRPILLLTSEAESGKTTATTAVKFAVEGHMDRGGEIPSKPDDVAVTVAASRMTVYNNVSNIDKNMSDFLCQVQGGSRYEKRKLRTDNDVVELQLVSSIIMNGITTGELRGDLKSRVVRLTLNPLTGNAMTDHDVEAALKAMHPEIFGALLTLAVECIKRIPTVGHPGKGFRMLEFTQILMALSEALNLGTAPMTEYKSVMDELSAEGMDDPLFDIIRRETLKMSNRVSYDKHEWTVELGTKQIIGLYSEFSFNKAMREVGGAKQETIATGEQLKSRLVRGITDWKRHGVSYENLGQKRHEGQKQTVYRFTFSGAEWFEHTTVA
jgi:hypothetical protein